MGPPDYAQGQGSYLQELQNKALTLGLHESRAWRKLLFIVPKWFNNHQSIIDSEEFFVAPSGKNNPKAELLATLSAFFEAEPSDAKVQHPQCAHAGRYLYLKKVLNFDSTRLTERACPKLANWRNNLQTTGVSLIFSAFYINNPSSGFGHTLLRLHRKSQSGNALQQSSSLLDWAVNFAAYPNTDNGLMYSLRGVSGGFPGRFSVMSYYLKVQEYNDYESRDMWEYDLGFSPEEVTFLQAVLWEVGELDVDYYYLDDNCAFVIHALLNAVRPDLDMTDEFNAWVTPPDTLRSAVETLGVSDRVTFRTSNLTRTRLRMEQLSGSELDCGFVLIGSPEELKAECLNGLEKARQAAVLDFVVEYLDLRDNPIDPRREHQFDRLRPMVLGKRAELGIRATDLVYFPADLQPDKGHSDGLISLAGGANEQYGAFARLQLRLSLHDRFASRRGYTEGLEIRIFDSIVRYQTESRKLYFESFDPIAIVSLSPMTRLNRSSSWQFNLGVQEGRHCQKPDIPCRRARMGGGAGVSFGLGGQSLVYLIPDIELGVTTQPDERYQLELGGLYGVIVPLGLRYKVFFDGHSGMQMAQRYKVQSVRAGLNMAPRQNQEYRLVGSLVRESTEYSLQAGYYF